MRILQWAFPFLPVQGGREVFVHNLSEALVDHGHQVMVATGTPGEPGGQKYEISRLPIKSPGHPNSLSLRELMASVLALHTNFQFEVVHFHNHASSDIFFLERLLKKAGVPLVQTLHGEAMKIETTENSAARLAWVGHWVDQMVCVSDFVRHSVVSELPEYQGPISTIENGTVRLTKVHPLGNEVLFMGRLVSNKGCSSLISALQLVKDRHPDVLLRICGDGPMRSALENLSVRLGLKDNVVFSGWLRGQDLQFAMDSSRMLVVPSAWREPFGLVAIEAMMNARPVIVSDRGGLVETIRDGIDGYIYQPGDIFELAAKIDNLLADKNLARQLGDSGRLRALDKFDMSLTAERYLELYKRAIERKNA